MQAAAEKISRIFKKKDGHEHEHEHEGDTSSEHSEHSVHEEVEAAPAAVDR